MRAIDNPVSVVVLLNLWLADYSSFKFICVQNPIILDPSSESEKVVGFLGELQEKMDELQKRAFMYKSYQKNFKVRRLKDWQAYRYNLWNFCSI